MFKWRVVVYALYRDRKTSFGRHENLLFMKKSILLGLLVTVRKIAEGVNGECTVMPRPFI